MTISPNWFAYIALFSWPIVTLYLFRRLAIERATLWSIVGAYLLLPKGTEVDLPMIPPLDKVAIPNLAVFFVCRVIMGKKVPLLPKEFKARILMLLYIGSPFMTALLNTDALIYGPLFIEGMKPYDALSAVIRQLIFILPFLLALQFFQSQKAMEEMLMVLVIAGVWYSFPMLLEVRLSPQLHSLIYGYFPHSFIQQMRGSGFRPVVFIGHGLWVAFFTMTALVASVALWRIKRSAVQKFSNGTVVAYLAVLLVLCKSMASLLYGFFLLFLVKFLKPKIQVRIAMAMALLALTYPVSRGLDLFPVQQMSELARAVSEERAHSFDFRIRNEEVLLNKVNQRPLFGWGNWGRNRIYDLNTGRDLSVTDGRWIIVIGQFGWAGLLAEFGLLALPIFLCAKFLRYTETRREAIVLAAVSLILGVSLLDLLPNNTMSPLTWLIAGALMARVESLKASKRKILRKRLRNKIQ